MTACSAAKLTFIEIYFSVVQQKVLTPNDFPDLATLEQRLLDFQSRYGEIAKPFKWKFTKEDLNRILSKPEPNLSANSAKLFLREPLVVVIKGFRYVFITSFHFLVGFYVYKTTFAIRSKPHRR